MHSLGKNPYGEMVVEDAAGQRFVATFSGWLPEAGVEPARCLRARDASAVELAAQSLAWEDISLSFQHSFLRAHAVWTAPAGSPVGDRISVAHDRGAQALARAVQVSRGDVIVAAVRCGYSLPSRPLWEQAIFTDAGNGARALQVGALRRHAPLVEWGVSRPENAINPAAVRPGSPKASFRPGSHEAPPSGEAFWWAPPGTTGSEFDAILRYPKWGVIFRDEALAWSPSVPHVRQRLVHQKKFVAWYLSSGPGLDSTCELLKFAGAEPPVRQPHPDLEDEFGRLPYHPRSPGEPSGAHAPRRMVHAMDEGASVWGSYAAPENLPRLLNLEAAVLEDVLTAEQRDAVAAAVCAIDQSKGFLLTDETGFGKGRTLAALLLAARAQGVNAVFVTRSAELASDLYRDLLDVAGPSAPIPELRHATAAIYDPDGKKVASGLPWDDAGKKPGKGKPGAKAKAGPRAPAPPAVGPRCIATTYSQLSRQNALSRRKWLQDQLGTDGWLILDEAHSAAGDSATGEQLAELAKTAKGVVFASATWARHEQNLGLYGRVLDLPEWQQKILRHALAGDSAGLLREALSHDLARQGRLLRREHPSIPPPPVIWVELGEAGEQAQANFAAAWQAIFAVVEEKESLATESQPVWLLLGGALARSVREWNMLSKVARLEDEVVAAVGRGEKPVVTFELTFESPLRDAFSDVPAPHPRAPLWRDRLTAVMRTCVGAFLQDAAMMGRLGAAMTRATDAIAILPDWQLDVLDGVAERLRARGVKVAELSGRTARLVNGPGGWKIEERKPELRQKLVRDFNAGLTDALLLSRAGSTGISLHAGVRFADQRPRFMLELDIPSNPIERQQFWGRVRRRDQVVEPRYGSLVLDTPEDRRVFERENRKRQKLQAHGGHAAVPELGIVSREGERAVAEWSEDRPGQARRLGVLYPIPEEATGRADRVLARGLVLPQVEREALWDRLRRAVDLGNDWEWRAHHDPRERPSRSYRRNWWWGDPRTNADGMSLEIVERTWSAVDRPSTEAMLAVIHSHAAGLSEPPRAALDRWAETITRETAFGERATDVRRTRWRNAQRLLLNMERGEGIRLTDPSTGEVRRALVLGAVAPAPAEIILPGASRWSPTQVALWIWMVGDVAPFKASLAHLVEDPAFLRSGRPAPSTWFSEPPAPLVAISVEGYSPAAAAWGQRFGSGRLLQVDDAAHGERLAWALPSHWSWPKMQAFPRDLLDAVQWADFWKMAPDCPVQVVAPNGKSWEARPRSGAVDWSGHNAIWRSVEHLWGMNVARRTSRIKDQEFRGAAGWTCFTTWQDVRALLHVWEAQGVVARIPAQYEGWLRADCARRFR